jgi:hypothetical protein
VNNIVRQRAMDDMLGGGARKKKGKVEKTGEKQKSLKTMKLICNKVYPLAWGKVYAGFVFFFTGNAPILFFFKEFYGYSIGKYYLQENIVNHQFTITNL